MSQRMLQNVGPLSLGDLQQMVASVFLGEALRPSGAFYLAAPVLADAPLLDNRAGGFSGLEPEWGERPLGLLDLLLRNLAHGGRVVVRTRRDADASTPRFLARLCDRAHDLGATDKLSVETLDLLDPTGLAGDGVGLAGALRFTTTGVEFADEVLTLYVGVDAGPTLAKFQAAYGRVSP